MAREGTTQVPVSVGKDAAVAFNSQVRKVKELEAWVEGLEAQLPKDDPSARAASFRRVRLMALAANTTFW